MSKKIDVNMDFLFHPGTIHLIDCVSRVDWNDSYLTKDLEWSPKFWA